MIFGLCSTWREGNLALGAARSALDGCDRVDVLEAAVGEPTDGPETHWTGLYGFIVQYHAPFTDDASKRSHMLRAARENGAEWVVWIDGDEILVNGYYLRDYLAVCPEDAVNWPIRLVQMNGAVEKAHAKVLRVSMIDEILVSSYQLRLTTGQEIALPNVPHYIPDYCAEAWRAQYPGVPLPQYQEGAVDCRPPVGCEPYIYHRTALRPVSRQVENLHEDEARWHEARA